MYGKIRCTFAEIYDADKNKLFSFQKKDIGNIAVVVADSIDGEYVPIYLTKEAAQFIGDKVKSEEHYNRIVESLNKGAFLAKTAAFDWSKSKGSKKPLLIAAMAALGLIMLKK